MESMPFYIQNSMWTPDEFIMSNAGPRGGTKRNKVKCKAQRKARKHNRK